MDKRVLMATVVSMGVVLVWIAFFGKPKHKSPSRRRRRRSRAAPGDRQSGDRAGRGGRGEAGRREADGEAGRRSRPTRPRVRRRRRRRSRRRSSRRRAAEALPRDLHVGRRGADELGAARSAVQGRQSALEQQAVGADRSGADARAEPAVHDQLPDVVVQAAARRGVDAWRRTTATARCVYVWENGDTRVEKRFVLQPHSYTSSSRSPSRTRATSRSRTSSGRDARLAGPERQAGRHVRAAREPDERRCATSTARSSARTSRSCSRRNRRRGGAATCAGSGVGEQYFFEAVGAGAVARADALQRARGAADGSMSARSHRRQRARCRRTARPSTRWSASWGRRSCRSSTT